MFTQNSVYIVFHTLLSCCEYSHWGLQQWLSPKNKHSVMHNTAVMGLYCWITDDTAMLHSQYFEQGLFHTHMAMFVLWAHSSQKYWVNVFYTKTHNHPRMRNCHMQSKQRISSQSRCCRRWECVPVWICYADRRASLLMIELHQ